MGGPGAGGPGAGAERAEVEDFGGRRGLAAKPVHGDKCLGWGTGSPGRAHDGWTQEWVLPRGHLGQEACPGVAAAQWLRWRVDLPVQLGFSATSAHCRAKPLSNPAVYFSPLPRHHLLPPQGTLSLSVSRLPSTPNPQWRTIPAAGR